MKFTSIFFAASAAIFLTCHKGTQFFGNQSLHGANFLLYIFIMLTNTNSISSHELTQIYTNLSRATLVLSSG